MAERDAHGKGPQPLICQVVECFRRGAWSKDEMPPLRRLALLMAASYGDPDGANIYPSQDTLAFDSAIARSALQGHLQAVREMGVLELVAGRGSGRRSDLHQLHVPVLDSPGERASGRPATRPAGGPQLALEHSRLALAGGATGPAGGPNQVGPSTTTQGPSPPPTRFARGVPPASGGDESSQSLGEVWERVRDAIELPDFKREIWIDPIEPVALDGHVLTIRPPAHLRTSVRDRYLPLIVEAAREVLDERLVVDLAGAADHGGGLELAAPRRRRRRAA